MTTFRTVALGAAVALTLVACGGGDDSSATSPETSATTSPPSSTDERQSGTTTPGTEPTTTLPATTVAPDPATVLQGATLVSTAVEGFALVDGTVITLTFDGPNLGADAGCNQLAGSWTLEGDVLVVPPMVQTMMACDPPAKMDQDTWLSALLTSRPTVSVVGGAVTLTAPGATVTFANETAATSGVPLEGTTWTVDSIVTGEAASSLPAGAQRPPTLIFETGALTLHTGCNNGSGSYTVAGDAITFDPIATTRMACGDQAAADVEQHVLGVLTGTATFTIDGGTLMVTNGDRGLVAQATAG